MASKDINTLQNAFPNIPHDIIETILESNLGDVDKAFDSLLEMSDPDFHSNDNRTSDTATSAARPASQRSRVSFQEPIDNYVQVCCLVRCQRTWFWPLIIVYLLQPTIDHWQTNVSISALTFHIYLFIYSHYFISLHLALDHLTKRTIRSEKMLSLQENLQRKMRLQLHSRTQHWPRLTLPGLTLVLHLRQYLAAHHHNLIPIILLATNHLLVLVSQC